MSRACFLSAGGDPFIALTVIKLWQERWKDEINHFYICYNNHSGIPINVVSEFLSRISKIPNLHIIYHPSGIGNGMPITEMTKIAKEDLIMLLEDDGFCFTPGIINKCFQDIESDLTDIVGSPRFSCGNEIAEASKIKYGLDYSTYGDCGPNFWPCFFFCKREDLLKTDLNFGSKSFKPGDYCKELDYTFKEINHGDTFVWASMQLRALGLRSHSVPQFHASPTEPEDKQNQTLNWYQGQTPYWIHGGSLSTSWNGYLTGSKPDISNENAIKELETRIAFWIICSDIIEGFEDFKKDYKQGIENLINNTSELNRNRVNAKINLYRNLMKI